MLDILEGDILIVGSKSYPIRFVGEYSGWATSPTFKRMANTTASTKRAPAIANGLRAAPTTKISSLMITPLDPAANDLQQRILLKSPFVLKECHAGDSTGFVRIAVEDDR